MKGNEFNSEEWQSIMDICKQARENKYMRRNDMQEIIQAACYKRWLSRRQLATLLDRHPQSLNFIILREMLDKGELEFKYPDNPTHKNQAYGYYSSRP